MKDVPATGMARKQIHVFLRYKKELTAYGYAVSMIFMKEQNMIITQTDKCDTLVLYIHGKGGSAAEADHYKPMFPACRVIGLDYRAATPWAAAEEFPAALKRLAAGYRKVILIANSIGAYFAMHALHDQPIDHAWFISPIADMAQLITDMIGWAQTTEAELYKHGEIPTNFGETLSWAYLTYVREHPVHWDIPTDVLYGSGDTMTAEGTIRAFCAKHRASLTVMEGGEHWFHTPEQMAFLDDWLRRTAGQLVLA